VAFDASGNLWGTLNPNPGSHADEVVEINPSNGAIANSYTTSGFNNLNRGQTVIDASGNLYAACGYGCNKVWEFNTNTDAFTPYNSIGGQTVYSNDISTGGNGTLWSSTYFDILNFSSPSGTSTVYGLSLDAATLNSGNNNIGGVAVAGSDLVYTIETYGGGSELGLLNINSPGTNIEYDPLMSITGGGTLSDPAYLATDSAGNVYTIGYGNPVSSLYELNATSDTWTAVAALQSSANLPFAFDSTGNLWQVGPGSTLEEYDLAAPEPSTWLLLAGGLGIAALRARPRTGSGVRRSNS